MASCPGLSDKCRLQTPRMCTSVLGCRDGHLVVYSNRVDENFENTVASLLRIYSLKWLFKCEVSIYKVHRTIGRTVLSSETLNLLVLRFLYCFLTSSQQH